MAAPAGRKSIYVHDEAAEATERLDLTGTSRARDVVQQYALRQDGRAAVYSLANDEGVAVPLSEDLYKSASHGDDFFVEKAAMVLQVVVATGAKRGNPTKTLDAGACGVRMDTTAAQAAVMFTQKFAEELEGQNVAGCSVSVGDTPLDGAAVFAHAVQVGDKVTITPAASSAAAAKPAAAAATEKPADKAQPDPEGFKDELELLRKYLSMGEEALHKKAYARAIEIYSKLQGAVPGEPQSAQGLAIAYMKAEKWVKAVEAWKHTLKLVDESKDDEYLETIVDYSEALIQAKQFETAVSVLSHALRLVDGGGGRLGHDLKTQLGFAYLGKGGKEGQSAAAALWTNVLSETSQEHVKAMLGYTGLMRQVGDYSATLRGLLGVLVRNTGNKDIREAFGDAMREIPKSVEVLDGDMPLKEEAASASAFGFLALVMKERGAVLQAVHYYRKALALCPDSACYALNLTHTMDIACLYWDALEEVAVFCRKNSGLSVEAAGHRVSCADVLKCLETPLKARDNTPFLSGEHAEAWSKSGQALRWVDDGATLASRDAPPQSTDAGIPPEMRDAAAKAAPAPANTYTQEELDLLALWFAATKKLYVLGCLSVLPELVTLLDPLRKGRALHTTLIRNEQAYFCTVGQLLQYTPIPPAPTEGRRLYVCGDSHSLSPSWNTVNIKGESHLLHNALVTGLKCWHLRDGTHFYPKYNFINVAEGIPKGSAVVMMFGEIDCREGILFAVEKGRHASVADGMQTTVDIYIKKLLELQKGKGWDIYVHPALPVLDVTRHLVTQFNEILAASLQASPKVSHNGKIKWLDFYKQMLSEDGKTLLPQYTLDGTHANPAYLSLMEAALNKVVA